MSALTLSPSDFDAAFDRMNYIAALKAHDWSYEYSDDHSVWIRGSNERSRLRRMQRELDPEHTLWNEHAPTLYRVRQEPA